MRLKLSPVLWRARFALANTTHAISRSSLALCLILATLISLLARLYLPSLSPETFAAIHSYERGLGLILSDQNLTTRSGVFWASALFLITLTLSHLLPLLTGTEVLKPGDSVILVMLRQLCWAAAFALTTLPFCPPTERFALAHLEALLAANFFFIRLCLWCAKCLSNELTSHLKAPRLRLFTASQCQRVYLSSVAICLILIITQCGFLNTSTPPLPLPTSARWIIPLPLPDFISSRILLIDQPWASIALLIWSLPLAVYAFLAPWLSLAAYLLLLTLICLSDWLLDFKNQLAITHFEPSKITPPPLLPKFLSFMRRLAGLLMNAFLTGFAAARAGAESLARHTQGLRSASLSLTPEQLMIIEAKRLGEDIAGQGAPTQKAKPRL